MRLMFSNEGARRLTEIAHGRLLCGFDFDGTLAPIVTVPGDARLPEPIRQRLLRLAELAPVAIITGRSVQDVKSRLGMEPDFVVGNHGMEGVPGWEEQAARHAALCAAWKTQLAKALRDPYFDPGIALEDKQYSLSVHYRRVDDPELMRRRLEQLFPKLDNPPRVVAGKYVFNLLAEDACHKGTALEQLMSATGADHALYVGDDVTDEDVFRLRRPDVLSVRIEQAPDSAAAFYLAQPEDIHAFLDDLLERLRARGARNWVRAG